VLTSYIPSDDVAVVRELVRGRAFLVRVRTSIKNRIVAALAYEGIDTPRDFRVFSKRVMEWLRKIKLDSINDHSRCWPVLCIND